MLGCRVVPGGAGWLPGCEDVCPGAGLPGCRMFGSDAELSAAADFFTKPLDAKAFFRFRNIIMNVP